MKEVIITPNYIFCIVGPNGPVHLTISRMLNVNYTTKYGANSLRFLLTKKKKKSIRNEEKK